MTSAHEVVEVALTTTVLGVPAEVGTKVRAIVIGSPLVVLTFASIDRISPAPLAVTRHPVDNPKSHSASAAFHVGLMPAGSSA